MKIGCLINLAIYAALVFAYHYWLAATFDSPTVWYVSCGVALLTAGALGAIYNSRLAARSAAVIRAALSGETPTDGHISAAIGTVEPLGPSLTAPFSGLPCVLCEYEIAETGSRMSGGEDGQSHGGVDFCGLIMAPCGVRTEGGLVRLFGFPNLDSVVREWFFSRADRKRAREFVLSTEWKDTSGIRMIGGIGSMFSAITGEDDEIRRHWRLISTAKCDWFLPPPEDTADANTDARAPATSDATSDGGDDAEAIKEFDREFGPNATKPSAAKSAIEDGGDDELDDDYDDDDSDDEGTSARGEIRTSYAPYCAERRVVAGERVVIVGQFDAARGGLVSRMSRSSEGMKLFHDDPQKIAGEFAASKRRRFWGGLVTLGIVHVVLFLALALYRNSNDTQRRWREQFITAITDNNLVAARALLDRGLDVNATLDPTGRTLLMRASNDNAARLLIEYGADVNAIDLEGNTPAIEAVRRNRVDVLKILIGNGADVNFQAETSEHTALSLANQMRREPCIAVLRAAGAKDETVTAADGQPIADDHEIMKVCREYVAAMHTADIAAMKRLSTANRKPVYADVEWTQPSKARTKEPESIAGFVRGDDATVIGVGYTADDTPVTWRFQLKLEEGRWRIRRERWDLGPER